MGSEMCIRDRFYYTFRHGPAFFVVLDCGEDKPDNDIEYSGLADFDRYRATAADWLKENDEATLLYAGDELISLEPQMFVELEVTHTEPGFKGDTATNTLKPATLETGKEVQVPTFIEIGDVLQIDTRDGRVIKRV